MQKHWSFEQVVSLEEWGNPAHNLRRPVTTCTNHNGKDIATCTLYNVKQIEVLHSNEILMNWEFQFSVDTIRVVDLRVDASFMSLTSYKMGQSTSSNAHTPLLDSKQKNKEKKDSKWKKYSQKYSTNTNSIPQHDKYKRLK